MIYDVWVTETYTALVRVEAESEREAQDKVDNALINTDPVNDMRFAGRSVSFMGHDSRVDIDLTGEVAEVEDNGTKALGGMAWAEDGAISG